ncbi:hypothetical protein LCGC14_1816370 [marine sediment metagenome]|uniref:Uncharacterized protein n=1 Tax=marine sediment metagenome TaxID=412755 RepID=A0A0F9GK87_9ZZZZ
MDILEEYRTTLAELLALDIDKKIMMTVDPNSELLDALSYQTGETRSNTMNFEDDNGLGDFDDDFDSPDDYEDSRSLSDFLSNLESFLDEELDEDSRGNVFMTKNGDGVSLNILVGAHFEECDEEINQVNIIVCPTDRSLLGSTGVSMDDREYPEDDDEDSTPHEAFDEALKIVE